MTEKEALKMALEALEEAADAIDSWGSYASGYFQVKHDLEGDISKAKSAITTIKEALSSCQCPECKVVLHASDCAVHNEPAYPRGQCNCGAQPEQEQLMSDQINYGMSVTQGGKRIDPMSIYKEPEHDKTDVRCECCGYMTYHREHLGCIRAAKLKEPEQEPVAWRYKILDYFGRPVWTFKTPKTDIRVFESQPLYTSPPQRTWVGLTDKDWNRSKHSHDFQKGVDWAESILKDKNT